MPESVRQAQKIHSRSLQWRRGIVPKSTEAEGVRGLSNGVNSGKALEEAGRSDWAICVRSLLGNEI